MDNVVKQAEDILLDSCQIALLDAQIEAEKALIEKLNEDIKKMYAFVLQAKIRLSSYIVEREGLR